MHHAFPTTERASVYSRGGIFRGSSSFTNNGVGLVGQNGASQNPIGGGSPYAAPALHLTSPPSGRAFADTVPRNFNMPGYTFNSSGARMDAPHAGALVDRNVVGKPAPHGGQHLDRRHQSHVDTVSAPCLLTSP